MIGAPMPDLNVQTINKENIQLPHPTAKIHVFFFWHLSCDPCLGLMEGLDHIKSKFEYQGVKFISFTPDDINTTIEEFYPYYTFNWPMIPNASQITKEAFAFSWGNPTIMIFDTNNKLAYIKAGAVNEPVIIQKIIEDLKLEIRHCLKK
ncbi:MAG: redoxin domain-containing protein [Saprospiraceae bacterium]|nr:redoxin domain-containing protein [Saprospiraceae bacterium]